MAAPLLLALDTGSPLVSVAVGHAGRVGEVLAERAVEIGRSSGQLVEMMGEVLAEAGARPADLGGVVALRGPGSFTGLRIGLATALGLHQALGVPATALSTLQVLAAAVQEDGTDGAVIAVVDALRGEWSAQAFSTGSALGEMELVPGGNLPLLFPEGSPRTITGFGISRLAGLPDWPADIRLAEAGALASTALRLAPEIPSWNAGFLIHPLYSRPPAVTPPKPRPMT